MANTIKDTIFTKTVTCTSSDQKEDLQTSRNEVLLIADADCFINFDEAVTTTNRMLLKANTYFSIRKGTVRQLHYKADSGTPKVYIMAFKSAHV